MRSSHVRLGTPIIVALFVAAACTSAASPIPVVPSTPTATPPAAATPSPASPPPATTAPPTPAAISSPTPSATAVPTGAALTWIITGNMVTPRDSHAATLLLDGSVLVTGGDGVKTSNLAKAELYDPNSGSWTATGKLTEGRRGHTATLLSDGTVLVAGGWSDRSDLVPSATAELYDPSTGKWVATARMAAARAGHTATLLADGTVLLAGGLSYCCGNGGPLDVAELFDPRTGSWTKTASMLKVRGDHTATLLPNGTVLVIGGIGRKTDDVAPINTTLAAAEIYDPATKAWTATRHLNEGRAGHTATLLNDGSVLVTRMGSQGSAELFDASTGSTAATGNMDLIRFNHDATLLPDRTVLVVGNSSEDDDASRRSAELYHPRSGRWTRIESMNIGRDGHTVTLLANGTVLVAGGNDESGRPVAAAELYDPGTSS